MPYRVASLFWIVIASTSIAVAIRAQPPASHGDSPPPRHLVDFSTSNNLKVLFDAGLHPNHVPGLETRTCEIGRSDLTIRLPNGAQFQIDVERASFGVRAENELGSARIFGIDESVSAASKRVKVIATSMELPVDGLDEITGDIGITMDANKRWHRSGRIGNLTVGVTFYPMFYRNDVKARAWVQLIWRRPPGTYRFLTEPIQPPPGYEHISMEPTPFPTLPPSDSGAVATATPVMPATSTPRTLSSPPGPVALHDASPTAIPPSTSPTPILPAGDTTLPRWLWLVLAALALVGIAFLYVLSRQSKS